MRRGPTRARSAGALAAVLGDDGSEQRYRVVVMAIEQLRPGVSVVPERWFGSSGSRLFGRAAEAAVLDQLVTRIRGQGGALVVRGDRTGVLLACIPGNAELDLRALAAASGNKKVELVSVKEVLGLTGYIRGGVSPVGTRKPYPLYLDETAELWDIISVSAGVRGCQMLLAPKELARVVDARRCEIAKF